MQHVTQADKFDGSRLFCRWRRREGRRHLYRSSLFRQANWGTCAGDRVRPTATASLADRSRLSLDGFGCDTATKLAGVGLPSLRGKRVLPVVVLKAFAGVDHSAPAAPLA